MNRETILNEIRRIAAENNGAAPGQEFFERATGITQGQWRGRLWLKWSEAVTEAGLTPSRMQEAFAEEYLLRCLATLARAKGHFPTSAEVRLQRTNDKSFPNHGVFERLGGRPSRVAKLRSFVDQHPDFSDVLLLLPATEASEFDEPQVPDKADGDSDGAVYMLKLGKHYKIGRTFDVPRRHRQIDLELPEKAARVHVIRTDDPAGIEAYWHKRFANKRTNGEWFALDSQDVKAFRRRKFM